MTAIDRTAYPRFRATLTPSELHEHFTPTAAELALAEAQTPDTAGKLAFLALYKCMQMLNYLPSEEEIPPEAIAHLRWYLQVADDVPAQVSPRSRRRYGQAIRQAMGLKHAVQEALQVARAAM